MYTEATNNYGVTFALDLPDAYFPLKENHRLQFSYHTYGSSMGTLEVLTETNVSGVMSWDVVWSKDGDQRDSWHDTSVTVPTSTYGVRFFGTTGELFSLLRQ